MREVNKKEEQQQKEKAIFEIFKEKCGLVGKFNQSKRNGPGPDFFGPYKEDILGVEITEIYTNESRYGIPLQKHEVEKEKIIREACNKAENQLLPPLIADVIFSYDHIPKGKKSYLANLLFEVVKSHIPPAGDQKDLVGTECDDLPGEFWAVYIYTVLSKKNNAKQRALATYKTVCEFC